MDTDNRGRGEGLCLGEGVAGERSMGEKGDSCNILNNKEFNKIFSGTRKTIKK